MISTLSFDTLSTSLGLFTTLGWTEFLVIGVVALLIFGRRLPEVGRNLGRGLVEFKKGLSGIEDDLKDVSDEANKAITPPPSPSSPSHDAKPHT